MRNFHSCFAALLFIAASSCTILTSVLGNFGANSTADKSPNNPGVAVTLRDANQNAGMENINPFSQEGNKVARFCSYMPYAKEAQAATG
jgi:hypothetical protein